MTRWLSVVILGAALATPAAYADDLLPSPPGSTQAPAQSLDPSPAPASAGPAMQATAQQDLAEARAACDADIKNLCPRVQPGGGRILACLKQHKDKVSPGCVQAVTKVLKAAN